MASQPVITVGPNEIVVRRPSGSRPTDTFTRVDIDAVNELLVEHVLKPAASSQYVTEWAIAVLIFQEIEHLGSESGSDSRPSYDQLRLAQCEVVNAFTALAVGCVTHRSLSVPSRADAVMNIFRARIDESLSNFISVVIPNRSALRRIIGIGRDNVARWLRATAQWPRSSREYGQLPIPPRNADTSVADEARSVIGAVAEIVWMLIRAVRLDCYHSAVKFLVDRNVTYRGKDGEIHLRTESRVPYCHGRAEVDHFRPGPDVLTWRSITGVLEELDLGFVGLEHPSGRVVWERYDYDHDDTKDKNVVAYMYRADPVWRLRVALASARLLGRADRSLSGPLLVSARSENQARAARPPTGGHGTDRAQRDAAHWRHCDETIIEAMRMHANAGLDDPEYAVHFVDRFLDAN